MSQEQKQEKVDNDARQWEKRAKELKVDLEKDKDDAA